MTIRMYARRKAWSLSTVSVDVTHSRVHAQDADTPSTALDHFTRDITLTGALTEDQREKLLAIADKCPVHKSLESSAQITTRLVEAADAGSP